MQPWIVADDTIKYESRDFNTIYVMFVYHLIILQTKSNNL